MCGITGYFGPNSLDSAAILHALAHRGPDSQGQWSTRLPSGHAVHLLHTRLAILDLSPLGNQPMRLHRSASGAWQTLGPDASASDDLSGYAVAYNGEIYNHAPLRAELEARGHRFTSHCDTEVVLRGYAEWGNALFARLDGIFAAVLFDGPQRRLVVARDHLGIKPLYYARDSRGGILFASEVRALLRSGLCPADLDRAALHDFLRLGSYQEPRTAFAAIRAFEPGCVGTLDLTAPTPGELSVERYWRPEHFVQPTHPNSIDWIARHAELFRETVREQLISDVPVGVFLSGGLDSTLLLETAARIDRERITAFTLGGATTAHDETAVAAQTAKNLNVSHKQIHLSDADQSAWIADALAAMDQPSADGVNTYLVSRAARAAGLVVALGGTGADEFHGAYGHAAQLARLNRAFSAAGIFSKPAQSLAACAVRLRRGAIAGERAALLFAQAHSPWRLTQEKRRFLTPSQIAAYWPDSAQHSPAWRAPIADEAALSALPLESQIILAEACGYLRNTLLRDSDWATMANHQELRVPFLGRRYTELMLQMPSSLLAERNGQKKPLLADLISAPNRALTLRPKIGFCINYRQLLRGPFRERFIAACETLNARLGFALQPASLLAELESPQSGKFANRLWALLALGAYL